MTKFSGLNLNRAILVFVFAWALIALVSWQVETNKKLSMELEALKIKVEALEKGKQ